jgi:hypothetical protein
MTFRHLIGGGFVAGLLLAGFNHNALASTFTNGDFTTYGQFDWGGTPAAEAILAANYNTVFASTAGDLEVGSPTGFTMVFSSAAALATYLPEGGAIGALDADLVDPTSSSSGAFGADVAALVLNIDFSDAGLLPQNVGIPFGGLVLVNFPKMHIGFPQLNGLTVRQFSAAVNTVLGGGSFGSYTIAQLDPIVANMNVSIEDGTGVGTFATTNLALPGNSLVIQTVSRSGSALTFTWNTIPDQRYQVQCVINLSQTNWTSLGGTLTATNTTTSATEISTNSQMFYRIQLLP